MECVEASTLEAMALDFVLAADSRDAARCLEIAAGASAVEGEAMRLDRLGPARHGAAAEAYRRAAGLLLEAAAACPVDHADREVLEDHAREVTARAGYLEGLGGLPEGASAALPLEEHIRAVTLSLGAASPPSAERAHGLHSQAGHLRHAPAGGGTKVMGAAAAVAAGTGLLLLGPLSAVAMGVGAAYASTREDKAGSAVRKVGKAGVKAVHHAQALDEEYRLTTKAMAVGQGALDQVKVVGAKCGISDKANETGKALHSFNERHKVTRTLGWGVSSAGSALSGLVSRVAAR